MLKNNLIKKFTTIFGAGKISTQNLCVANGGSPLIFTAQAKEKRAEKLTALAARRPIGHDLKEKLKSQIELLWLIRLRRGVRNKFGLPSRGQRTHTNAKTKKKYKI